MEIKTAIAGLMGFIAYLLAMRYNLHMFQLNGYKNIEHINRMKKNMRMQWVLYYGMALGLVCVFLPCLVTDILLFAHLALIAVVYNAIRHMSVKKKLVYTARVKRLIVTNTLLAVTIPLLAGAFAGLKYVNGTILFVVGAQVIMPVLANLVNHPLEWAVKQHFINDAKRKLKSVPGLKIIGVTGSYGKTSVKFYLKTLLSAKYNVLCTPESYNTPMGVVKTIRESLKPTDEIFICEMGARHVGDIKEICNIVHPHHGVITSIGPQHLETFFNMDNIKKTKFELGDALPEDGLLFLNGDNEYIKEKAPAYKNTVFFHAASSKGNGKGYFAKDVALTEYGTEFTVVAPSGEEERFAMKLIGGHNVINVVGAIAVANTFGISLSDLKIPVRRIESVAHRMQMRNHGNVTIIDDAYNSNPTGSKAAVETLAMFKGLRILVTPGMVELGSKEADFNRQFGVYAAECCDYILLVGKKRTLPIYEGAKSKGFDEKKLLQFDKLEEALNYAYSIKGQEHKYILLENDLPDNY
ncbi:MAG: UDP-N-acetylmuramoyl-tripeptide--D-alanyl-D-alanine ligase [Lachnospiraceae bacterium]|nr:UDP-N-acetylmuramoyl-tripeptide--D-alanyl-D-alanine ligase [Lachnospiraceae bacterium]